MKDEEFVYYQDVKEKKITSRSARNQRTHTGKGGRVKLPSDNLTQKELKAMSGEVKSYRLNEPMTWVEFKAMPDDLKVTYIKLLRQKFDVSDREIAKMFGISQTVISKWVRTLGIAAGTPLGGGGFRKWDEAGWRAWLNREAPPQIVEESTPEEISGPFLEEDVSFPEEPNPKVEEPDHMETVFVPCYEVKRAIPHSGSMNFEGDIGEVLETVSVLLGGAFAKVCISWEVCEPDGEKMEG